MYKHILVATDGSELAAKAVAAGLELAKAVNARATVVTVTEPWTSFLTGDPALTFPIDDYEKAAAANAEQLLGSVSTSAKAMGVACETVHAIGFPSEMIIETAKAKSCDLIVMASHGRRGLARVLLGSQAMKVLTESTVPVLICR